MQPWLAGPALDRAAAAFGGLKPSANPSGTDAILTPGTGVEQTRRTV
jgi:hypothetical protein